MQKLAFQEHKNNIRNNKFRPKTNKIFNKHKKWKIFSDCGVCAARIILLEDQLGFMRCPRKY